MSLILPKWTEDFDRAVMLERAVIDRFLVRAAALYYSPSGELKELTAAIGLHHNALNYTYRPHNGDKIAGISPKVAKLIERAVGKDVMPMRLLVPDYFD